MRRLFALLVATVVPAMSCSFDADDLRALRTDGSPAGVEAAPHDDAWAVDQAAGDGTATTSDAPVTFDSVAGDAGRAEGGVDGDVSTGIDAPADVPMAVVDAPLAVVDAPLTYDGPPSSSDGDGLVDADERCSAGTKRCRTTVLEICDDDGNWNPTLVRKDICGAECTPGQSPDSCDGRAPRSCGAGGRWQAKSICDFVCTDGVCSGECMPGSARCKDKTPQTCSERGAWLNETACEHVCEGAGKCGGVCSPGAASQCAGTILRICTSAGQWQDQPITPGTCGADCVPYSSRSCGNCGKGTDGCTAAGKWGGCQNTVGAEVLYFRDADGDGYGSGATRQTSCVGAPAGYVANDLDCCDADASANPGQTGYFSGVNGCGNWDYNCDGAEAKLYGQVSCCDCSSSDPYACAVASCGQQITKYSCVRDTYYSSCKETSSQGGAQKCR